MVGHQTVERHRARTGSRRPSMDRPPPIDRKQTTGHPSTARRQGFHHRHTESRMPVRRRAPRVISSGDAVRGAADGSASVTRKSMPDPTTAMHRPKIQTITARVDLSDLQPFNSNRADPVR
jgi:hypothetical protein